VTQSSALDALNGPVSQGHSCFVSLMLPNVADAFHAFLDDPYPVFLDSAMAIPAGGWMDGYSLIVSDPILTLKSRGNEAWMETGGARSLAGSDPFEVLRRLLASHAMPSLPDLPFPQGAAIGYLGFDLGQHIERLPHRSRDDLALPEMYLAFYDWCLVHHRGSGRTWIVATGLPDRDRQAARQRLEWALERLHDLEVRQDSPVVPQAWSAGDLRSNFKRDRYLAAVETAKDYLVAGDIYQVNLSQRFQGSLRGDSWQFYRRLREVNPPLLGAYLGFPEATVMSASPEEFLYVQGRQVRTRPIKGTRPRGLTPAQDQELGLALTESIKDRAENLMIVDLMRNDLGRVCRIGSVRVPRLFGLEAHPTVFHLVSTVTGELEEGRDVVDLLRASFPGGSVTGAPKIRAIEIIDELEPHRRGVYCGGIGMIDFAGNLHLNMAIRTLTRVGDSFYFHVGGAIVFDSDPADEYEETLHKGRGLLRALGYD
jgi:para-aminobenzoate synthetase component 1